MVNNPCRINDLFREVRFARSKRGCDVDYGIDCLGKTIKGVGSAEVGDLDEDEGPRLDVGRVFLRKEGRRFREGADDGGYVMAGGEKLGEDVGSHAADSTCINLSDKQGCTPLHWVCRNGDVDTVNLLIDSEADLQSMRSWTPLDAAIFCGNNSLISTLS